ncbi:MAG TPA: hypothetical protein VGB73_17035 [Pyrinomonadaceae bacterium]|jgi:hypothetical protein
MSELKDNLILPQTPYRGAESFRYIDHPIFFVRKAETRKLLRQIIIYRGVLLYGDSGAGKSSLINAGLIPDAIEEGFTPNRIRLQPTSGKEIIVERISQRDDGRAPFLPSNLLELPEDAANVTLSTEDFRRRLEAYHEKFREAGVGHYPLFIFDQFEEFVTRFEEAPPGDKLDAALKVRDAILRLLIELLQDDSLPIKLLFVFREDYLARIVKLFSCCPELTRQSLRLTSPETAALDDIIRGPFQDEQLRKHFGREISEAAARELIAQITKRNKSNYVNLSEVQIACLELWRSEEDSEALLKRKSVQELLEDYLTFSLSHLSDQSLRDPAIALLGGMVTPSGKRNVISGYNLKTLYPEFSAEQIDRALKALVEETRLVRREYYGDEYYYDIISEFLVPWIIRQNKERQAQQLLARQRELEAKQRVRRRVYRSIALVVVLMAVFSTFAAYWVVRMRTRERIVLEATQQLQEVEREKAAADERVHRLSGQLEAVEGQRNYALMLKERAERERDEALQRQAAATRFMQLGTKGNQNRRLGMFGSTMLEIALGLILIYVLLSLVCVVVQEMIESKLNMRGHYLRRAIKGLLEGERRSSEELREDMMVDALYHHPLIKGLQGKGLPSYIPSDMFALALLDIVSPAQASKRKRFSDVRADIVGMPDSDLKRSLLLLVDEGRGSIENVQRGIERWYETAVNRVSGLYRRRTQYTLFMIALLLTVLMNVNTLTVADRISQDAALRESLVAQAQALAQQAPSTSVASAGAELPPAERIRQNLTAIESLGLPIGWSEWARPKTVMQWLSQMLGWLLTAVVVTLGAPLCFDILNRFAIIRSTIKPREAASFQPPPTDKILDRSESEEDVYEKS